MENDIPNDSVHSTPPSWAGMFDLGLTGGPFGYSKDLKIVVNSIL